jgi:TetR/AcrR family transcriptional regulator
LDIYLGFIIFDQMGKKSIITQNKIAETARELFLEKGFDGVKMQELADRAGVNKGLLHHYFKNKQSLFDDVFAKAIDQLFGKIETSLASKGSLEDKINLIVDAYFDMLLSNPKLPIFVFSELNRNPELLQNLFSTNRISILINGLKKENNKINDKNAIHIILTIVSLSVFPFMARPIVLKMVKNEENFSQLIEERRPMIKLLVSNLVKSL